MKISVNCPCPDKLFELSDIQKKVMLNDIKKEDLEKDLKRRLQWVLMHKYENCFQRLKKQWEPKLAASGVKAIPTDKDECAALIFSQPTYKDRSDRESGLKI